MKDKKVIQVFEYDYLYHHKVHNGHRLTLAQFEALVQYNDRHSNKYFTVVHKGLRFKQYVGVIQVGNLTIEILPKADKESHPDKQKWQRVLFQMLRACRLIQVEATEEARLQLKQATLLDLFIEQFLNETTDLIHKGLVKQYRKVKGNQKALVGNLQFAKHISKNLIHKERFYVRHQVYDTIHLLHQILHEALQLIPSITTNPNFADRVARQLLEFMELPTKQIQATDFDKITYNRKTAHYNKAIALAKLILLNYSPNIKTGKENVLAILFDMNKLFEEYIYRQLQRVPHIKVSAQKAKQFWNTKLIKPDLVVEINGITYVLDTKWKVLHTVIPSDADLKQMYAYQNYWDAHKTLLLYPQVYDLANQKGIFKHEQKECSLLFLSILDEKDQLNPRIGEELVAHLLTVD